MTCRGRQLAPPWSEKERALIKKWYTKEGGPKSLHRFPGRTLAALRRVALGMKVPSLFTRPVWSRGQSVVLAHGWHESGIRVIRKTLAETQPRKRSALVAKAKRMGLGPRLQGMLSVTAAAVMVGCSTELLTRIAKVEGVALLFKYKRKQGAWRVVDEESITKAALNYFRRETQRGFLERSGLTRDVLCPVMIWAGMKTQGTAMFWRLLPEEWDSLMVRYQARGGDG